MALLEKETLDRTEYLALMGDVPFESASSETVGTIRVLAPSVDPPVSLPSLS